MDLAQRRGIEVSERAIWPEELESFEQMFLTGTAVEVTPSWVRQPLGVVYPSKRCHNKPPVLSLIA